MLWSIGVFVVLGSVFLGFFLSGGHISVIWQPSEYMIIIGCAIGALIVSNTRATLMSIVPALKRLVMGSKTSKEDAIDLLSLIYFLFRLAKFRGILALEKHIENPSDSPVFLHFARIRNNTSIISFLCDYFRLLSMGVEDAHEIEGLIDEEIATRSSDQMRVPGALHHMAESLPALGIVAAVLGVIHTMGSITEPPEVLGRLIGAALVGTFLGVLLSYGFVGPIASGLSSIYRDEACQFECIKMALGAYMRGNAPAICVEFGRKVLLHEIRPSFSEVEKVLGEIELDVEKI